MILLMHLLRIRQLLVEVVRYAAYGGIFKKIHNHILSTCTFGNLVQFAVIDSFAAIEGFFFIY